MSDPVSALGGASSDGAVRVEEEGLRGMVTLRGDLSDDRLRKAVADLAGVELPGQRGIALGGERAIAWMSPDELLLMLPYDNAAAAVETLTATLKGSHHLAVNVSDARAVFRLTGPGVREVIAKGAPVDMAPGRFEPGEIRRTRLGQVAAAFWMVDGETVELVCFRSVAGFVFDWLTTAARKGSLPDYL